VLVHLARERTRVDVEDAREALHELVAAFPGHVADPQLDRRPRDVGDDRPAAAVENRPARRLAPHEAELVVLGGVQVLVARQHLQRPQAQKEEREREQGDGAEDADPQREGRGQPMRLADSRVGRKKAPGR
jgi:hypothetical protein